MVGTSLLTQYFFGRIYKLPSFDPRSPFISSLSLCLLLRTSSISIAALAAFVAIASKFLIRWRGKHIFNPTNFGIVAMALATNHAWISPGQWGSAVWLAFLLACLGSLVVTRAARADITLAVCGFYAAILFGRAWWLGDPMAIPIHQMQNGAFLIFAFFMISDPKTTPNARAGRIAYALAVVALASWIQFGLYKPSGFLYALALCAVLTPLIDWLLPAAQYAWPGDVKRSTKKGVCYGVPVYASHGGGRVVPGPAR
jgi:Na+-transporting NADH:ubiquinone oxidoreductase subunit NqrB